MKPLPLCENVHITFKNLVMESKQEHMAIMKGYAYNTEPRQFIKIFDPFSKLKACSMWTRFEQL